jgi:uncharacterized membrane protein
MKHSQSIRSRIVGVNIPRGERVATALIGASLVGIGLARRSLSGLLAAGAGTALIVRAGTGRCPAYRARAIRKGIHVRRVVTIQAPASEVYALWRDLTNLPRFMEHVESVKVEGNGVSRWTIKEGRRRLSYRARITEDTPNQRLRWESLPGGDIAHVGSLELREAPGDRGTEVEVKLHYFPPGGIVVASALYAFLRRLVRTQVGIELARLRQLVETGEIATGARRLRELEEDEKRVLHGRVLRPETISPVSTARRSEWPTGGAR